MVYVNLFCCFSDNQSTTESPASSSPGPGIDYLPPCDRSTNDITQAYKMNDLVSPDILDSLHSIAEEVLNMDLILLASDSRCESLYCISFYRLM